jgi:hypothetical protein
MRKFSSLIVLMAFLATAANAQTITFPNASPVATVKLEAGSQVSLDANGNLIARCDAGDPAGCARLLQTGGGGGQCGTGVTFTTPLSVTNPATPPAPGPYPGGSQLTLSAQMSGALVCLPSAFQGQSAINITGWTAPLIPSGNTVTQTINLPTQPETTYTLRLTCYGSTGSAVSERTVATSAQVNPPPPQCPPSSDIPYTSASPGATAPTRINGVSVLEVNGFESLFSIFGTNVNPFPSTGLDGNLIAPSSTVRIIRFTVPSPFPSGDFLRRFRFNSWPNGFGGGSDAYISVSTCPGDLRVPTATQSGTAPNDSTYAEACRNWRGNSWTFDDQGQGDLPYVVGVPGGTNLSTPNSCVLEPGRTYYLNIYMNKPNRATRSLTPQNLLCPAFDCGHALNAGA